MSCGCYSQGGANNSLASLGRLTKSKWGVRTGQASPVRQDPVIGRVTAGDTRSAPRDGVRPVMDV